MAQDRQLKTLVQNRDSWRHLPRTEKAGDTGSGQRQLETLALDRDS